MTPSLGHGRVLASVGVRVCVCTCHDLQMAADPTWTSMPRFPLFLLYCTCMDSLSIESLIFLFVYSFFSKRNWRGVATYRGADRVCRVYL